MPDVPRTKMVMILGIPSTLILLNLSEISFPPTACISPRELTKQDFGNSSILSQNLSERKTTKLSIESSSVLVSSNQCQQGREDELINEISTAHNFSTPATPPVCHQEGYSAGDQEPQSLVDDHVIEVDLNTRKSSLKSDPFRLNPHLRRIKEENTFSI
ncbi:hypothetical protein DFH28DRAFT_60387 [Melampsora americana]|nr:hypothetical protein DFH28DRAFT_60387 [Melampsora americana]